MLVRSEALGFHRFYCTDFSPPAGDWGDGDYLPSRSNRGRDLDEVVWTQSAWRTEPARAGVGEVRPLSYAGFQEVWNV